MRETRADKIERIIELYKIGAFYNKEIAKIVGVSYSTVQKVIRNYEKRIMDHLTRKEEKYELSV